MKKLILVMVVTLLGSASFAQNTDALVDNYLLVKNAMVKSDAKATTEAIHAFYKSVSSDKSAAQKSELLNAAEKLNKATDLKEQRDALNEVSTAMWVVVKGAEKVKKPLYYQYCPMKKGYWLSTEKNIENPYYGSGMLTCGRVVETKD